MSNFVSVIKTSKLLVLKSESKTKLHLFLFANISYCAIYISWRVKIKSIFRKTQFRLIFNNYFYCLITSETTSLLWNVQLLISFYEKVLLLIFFLYLMVHKTPWKEKLFSELEKALRWGLLLTLSLTVHVFGNSFKNSEPLFSYVWMGWLCFILLMFMDFSEDLSR